MPKELLTAVSCIIAYLLGSLSGGIIISRIAGGPDLHTVGSKSTGASNVQRTMGWKYGILTFLFDAVKGLLSCFIAFLITGSHFGSLLAGLCCVIGHNWPVFFRFKGGKGVATTGAVMLFQQATFIIGGERASILSTLEPTTSVIVGILVFHETVGIRTIAGSVLVILASLLIAVFDMKKAENA